MKFANLASAFANAEAASSRLHMTHIIANELFSQASGGEECRQITYMIEGSIAPAFEGLDLGVGERFALAAVALCAGVEEARVEREYRESGDLGSAAEKLLAKRRRWRLQARNSRWRRYICHL